MEDYADFSLRDQAAQHVDAIYGIGEAGYCHPSKADWRQIDQFPIAAFLHLMEDWQQWFADEVQMDVDDQLGRDWSCMTVQDIREPIVAILRGEDGYIWDGWHRVAACIVAGREYIPAIVGYPLSVA